MVADDAVGDAVLHHVVGDVGSGAVDEAGDEIAAAVQFRHGV